MPSSLLLREPSVLPHTLQSRTGAQVSAQSLPEAPAQSLPAPTLVHSCGTSCLRGGYRHWLTPVALQARDLTRPAEAFTSQMRKLSQGFKQLGQVPCQEGGNQAVNSDHQNSYYVSGILLEGSCLLSRIQDLRVVGGVTIWGRSTTNTETNNLPKIIRPGRGEDYPNIGLQRAVF